MVQQGSKLLTWRRYSQTHSAIVQFRMAILGKQCMSKSRLSALAFQRLYSPTLVSKGLVMIVVAAWQNTGREWRWWTCSQEAEITCEGYTGKTCRITETENPSTPEDWGYAETEGQDPESRIGCEIGEEGTKIWKDAVYWYCGSCEQNTCSHNTCG